MTGLISQEEYDERKDKGYGYTDTLGKSGIEAAFEEELRGTPGQHIYEAGEDGNVRLVRTVETAPGHSVYLTIGYDLNDSSYTGEEEGGVTGITDQRLLDVTIKCMRGIPYPDGSGGYRIDDKESYTIKNTYKMSVNR